MLVSWWIFRNAVSASQPLFLRPLYRSTFSGLTLLVGWQEGHRAWKKNRVVGCWGMVICLERGADFLVAQLMPLPLTVSCFSKVQIGLLFWYRLTWVVPEKGPLNRCVYRSTCISWHLLLRIGVFLVAKFYCPCALADDCAVSQNHNFFGI